MAAYFDDILFVLVTCTQEETRRRGLEATVRSLNEQHETAPFDGNLVVFDNASAYLQPLQSLKVPAIYAMSPENIGYWGALLWTLRNVERLTGRTFKFIHPVESDFVIYDLPKLRQAQEYLEAFSGISTVRTQEFRVRQRFWFYKHRWNPFRIRRSQVSNRHAITDAVVSFHPSAKFPTVFTANWHAKVPALHKWGAFEIAIEELAKQPKLTERDFMREMHRHNGTVGVLDGGIWWMHLAEPKKASSELSGSYSSPDTLKKYQYRNTRVDAIPPVLPEVVVRAALP